MKRLFASAALLTTVCGAASGNIVLNGGFETYGGSGNSNIGAGIAPWVIGGAGIDIVIPEIGPGHYFLPQEGKNSLSLNWDGPGSVSQNLFTTSGQFYEVSFWMAAEVYGGQEWRTMDVVWSGNIVGSPSFQYTGQGPEEMGWVKFSYVVQGTGSDELAFVSTTPNNYGPALDAVSVVPVPAPSVGALLAIAGGLLVNRRRRLRCAVFVPRAHFGH